MDYFTPLLSFIDAVNVRDDAFALEGMDVRNSAEEQLGTVHGLVVDSDSGRPRYLVVDADGWLSSKQFLVPVDQARLAASRHAFIVALSAEQISHFPSINTDSFDQHNRADVKRINDRMTLAPLPGVEYAPADPYSLAWSRPA